MSNVSRISTHLWFDNNARQAVEFYVSLIPNSRIVNKFGFGEGGPEKDGSFTSLTFELDGQRYLALNGGPHLKLNSAVSIFVRCDTQAEIDRLWDALLEGGAAQRCGWLTDRFGLTWQIVPAMLGDFLQGGGERSKRAIAAMMQMIKLDIAALKQAYDG